MKVSGFTFLRDAAINGYPFIESIRSLLPLVDEFVCVIGEGADDTRAMVSAIGDPRIKIIDTVWNEKQTTKGFVYAEQKMIGHYHCTGDWAFYLEADEVLHEDDIPAIRKSLEMHLDDPEVEALYFKFIHFYGSPRHVGLGGYRYAPRVIKTSVRAIAPDGLFWMVLGTHKKLRYPNAKSAQASIYHYGHCRKLEFMNNKLRAVGKYWDVKHQTVDSYGKIDIGQIRSFEASHPQIIRSWLESSSQKEFEQDPKYQLSFRDIRRRLRLWLEIKWGIYFGKLYCKALDR